LARYDKNKNGVLDPEELAVMKADQEAVRLDVFEVKSDKDIGYQAIDAGTGGRIDLPFKLSANALSAMTKEFMEDWSITDMRDAFRYSMSVDAGNQTQNGFPYGDFEFNFRGAGSSGNYPSRNGFLNYSVADAYNNERFEFSMGPNTILFGDGQIGGLASSSTKQARFNRNFTAADARWDSWGGWRFTGDTNYVVSKKYAVRLNLLYQRNTANQAWRDGLKSLDRGLDLTMTYAFTPNTQLSTDFEFNNKRNVIIATTYQDQYGYYTPGYTYDRLNPNLPASQGLAGISSVSGNAQNWTIIPALPQYGNFNTGNNQYYRTNGPGLNIQPDGRSDLPGIPTVAKLPYEEWTLGAPDALARFKQQTYTVNLDHRFSDKVSGRVSFYDYNNDRNSVNASAGTLIMDINKYGPDGLPNPKVGMLYAEVSPSRQYQENYVYEWRGLVTYRTPIPFWHAKGQFALVLGDREERFEAKNRGIARVDGANPNYGDSTNSLRYRFYVDEPMKYPGGLLPKATPGFTYQFIERPGNIQWKGIEYGQLVSQVSLFDERISLVVGTRNDFVHDDQIAGINGFNDIHGVQAVGASIPGVGPVVGAHALTKASALTSNAGVVAWIDKGQHFGVFYNYSENFAAPTSSTSAQITSYNADGTVNFGSAGPQRGLGNEMGLKFNFFDGRFSAEARYYKNEFTDRIEGGASLSNNFQSIWNSSGASYVANTALAQLSFRDLQSGKTFGYEFKAVANIAGIRLTGNFALPKTESGVNRTISEAYYRAFLPKWQQFANTGLNDKGEPITAAEATNINNQITNVENSLAGAVPGTTNNGTNKWTGSLAAAYQFSRESKLRGVSVGYGINGRGKQKRGSVPAVIKFNLTAVGARAPTPDENRQAAFDYIYQPSYYTQDVNVAYRKRIGKYNYRFQLNINNVTDKDTLLFNSYVSNYRVLGQSTNPITGYYPNGFNYMDPRKFILTTSVDF